MALSEKYKELIGAAQAAQVTNLNVAETDGVLHVSGNAPTGAVKDQLWDIYNKIDPNFLAGDLVLDITSANAAEGCKVKVVTESSNLNIRKGPGTDQP